MRTPNLTTVVAVGVVLSAVLVSCEPSEPEDSRVSSISAADTLLSLNKPATASTSGGCCGPQNVDDGNTGTRWASGANIDPSWIYIDLGGTFSVHRVQLTWDQSCAVAYDIQISPDHNAWTTLHSTTNGAGGVENITGLNGSGRYVRMLGEKRCRADAAHGYSLQELAVYGAGGDTIPPTPPGMPNLVSDTSSSVTISWTASTDNVGVTGYDVFHRSEERV